MPKLVNPFAILSASQPDFELFGITVQRILSFFCLWEYFLIETIDLDIYAMAIIVFLEKTPHIPVSESIGKFDCAMMIIACCFFFVCFFVG